MHPAQVMFFGMAAVFAVAIICLAVNERHINKGQIWDGKGWE